MSVATRVLFLGLAGALAGPAWSQQGQVFRCGNEYTNDPQRAQQLGCTTLELGPVMVVPGTKVVRTERPAAVAKPADAAPLSRIDAVQQRARDVDARGILEAELKKAEARLSQLQAEYNNGEPDKQGIEGRNHQRYLDRVQVLREDLIRQQSDVASLRRELARLPAAPLSAAMDGSK